MQARVLEITGEGPPLVYVPGIDGTGRYLLGTAERLAARFRLVCLRYEVVGPPPPAGHDAYGALARSVGACLDELGIDRCLVLTESFGGAVSLRLALDDPERVAGLLVVNSFAHYPWRRRLLLSRALAPLVPRPLYLVVRPHVAPPALFRPRRDPEAERRFLATPPAAFDVGYRRRLRMIRGLDLRPRLPEVRQPVALFAADSDRVVAAVSAGEVLHAGLADSTLEILPRTGHLALPLGDEPWLARVEALAARADHA